jgi:hypothetical protein
MKKSLIALLVLFSTNVWAASQLVCHVGEVEHPNETEVDYDLSAPLTGDNDAGKIYIAHAKSLNLGFEIETSTSNPLNPGQPTTLISVQDNGTDTFSFGGLGVMTFFDTTAGSLYINCFVQ